MVVGSNGELGSAVLDVVDPDGGCTPVHAASAAASIVIRTINSGRA